MVTDKDSKKNKAKGKASKRPPAERSSEGDSDADSDDEMPELEDATEVTATQKEVAEAAGLGDQVLFAY